MIHVYLSFNFCIRLRRTPLLLAASSGALESVKILIDLGANIRKTDTEKNTMIHLAALRFHTNVLEYFIEWNHRDVPVWQTLIGKKTRVTSPNDD